MPCWVVPTIAAEIWGVSVEHVLQRVRSGSLPCRLDEGFMFVDVMSADEACSSVVPSDERPPTFTALSEAEVDALAADECDEVIEAADKLRDEIRVESQSPDNDEASVDLGDWRAARARVGVTRIPPRRQVTLRAA